MPKQGLHALWSNMVGTIMISLSRMLVKIKRLPYWESAIAHTSVNHSKYEKTGSRKFVVNLPGLLKILIAYNADIY
jgi:hypothetical protein